MQATILRGAFGCKVTLRAIARQRRLDKPDSSQRHSRPFGQSSNSQWQQFGQMVLPRQFQQDESRIAQDRWRLKGRGHAAECNDISLTTTIIH
jgi:hypothetical protein